MPFSFVLFKISCLISSKVWFLLNVEWAMMAANYFSRFPVISETVAGSSFVMEGYQQIYPNLQHVTAVCALWSLNSPPNLWNGCQWQVCRSGTRHSPIHASWTCPKVVGGSGPWVTTYKTAHRAGHLSPQAAAGTSPGFIQLRRRSSSCSATQPHDRRGISKQSLADSSVVNVPVTRSRHCIL